MLEEICCDLLASLKFYRAARIVCRHNLSKYSRRIEILKKELNAYKEQAESRGENFSDYAGRSYFNCLSKLTEQTIDYFMALEQMNSIKDMQKQVRTASAS